MRKFLFFPLGLAGLLALVNVNVAMGLPNIQGISAKVTPKKLPKNKRVPVSLFTDFPSSNPGNPFQLPNPTTLAKIDIAKDLATVGRGLPTCDPSQFSSATTTQDAKSACPDSI